MRRRITARGAAAGWARQIIKRAQAMAAQLVTLHGEAIFALARQLYERGALPAAEVRELCARVAPVTLAYIKAGKPVDFLGIITMTLHKGESGWRVSGLAWADQ